MGSTLKRMNFPCKVNPFPQVDVVNHENKPEDNIEFQNAKLLLKKMSNLKG